MRTFKSELKNSLLKSKTSLLFNCDKFADKSFAFRSELELQHLLDEASNGLYDNARTDNLFAITGIDQDILLTNGHFGGKLLASSEHF